MSTFVLGVAFLSSVLAGSSAQAAVTGVTVQEGTGYTNAVLRIEPSGVTSVDVTVTTAAGAEVAALSAVAVTDQNAFVDLGTSAKGHQLVYSVKEAGSSDTPVVANGFAAATLEGTYFSATAASGSSVTSNGSWVGGDPAIDGNAYQIESTQKLFQVTTTRDLPTEARQVTVECEARLDSYYPYTDLTNDITGAVCALALATNEDANAAWDLSWVVLTEGDKWAKLDGAADALKAITNYDVKIEVNYADLADTAPLTRYSIRNAEDAGDWTVLTCDGSEWVAGKVSPANLAQIGFAGSMKIANFDAKLSTTAVAYTNGVEFADVYDAMAAAKAGDEDFGLYTNVDIDPSKLVAGTYGFVSNGKAFNVLPHTWKVSDGSGKTVSVEGTTMTVTENPFKASIGDYAYFTYAEVSNALAGVTGDVTVKILGDLSNGETEKIGAFPTNTGLSKVTFEGTLAARAAKMWVLKPELRTYDLVFTNLTLLSKTDRMTINNSVNIDGKLPHAASTNDSYRTVLFDDCWFDGVTANKGVNLSAHCSYVVKNSTVDAGTDHALSFSTEVGNATVDWPSPRKLIRVENCVFNTYGGSAINVAKAYMRNGMVTETPTEIVNNTFKGNSEAGRGAIQSSGNKRLYIEGNTFQNTQNVSNSLAIAIYASGDTSRATSNENWVVINNNFENTCSEGVAGVFGYARTPEVAETPQMYLKGNTVASGVSTTQGAYKNTLRTYAFNWDDRNEILPELSVIPSYANWPGATPFRKVADPSVYCDSIDDLEINEQVYVKPGYELVADEESRKMPVSVGGIIYKPATIEAKIGTTYFSSLAAAVASGLSGDIILLADGEIASLAAAATIEMNGYNLSLTGDTLANNLTVKGTNSTFAATGTKNINADLNLAAVSNYAEHVSLGTLKIGAGKTVTLPVNVTIWNVSGVSFSGSADGAHVTTQVGTYTYGNGVWAVGSSTPVAKIETMGYGTLTEALAAGAGTTVVMLQNLSENAASSVAGVTLNLDDHTLSAAEAATAAITVTDGSLTITNGEISATKAVAASGDTTVVDVVDGIFSGSFVATGTAKLNILGGFFLNGSSFDGAKATAGGYTDDAKVHGAALPDTDYKFSEFAVPVTVSEQTIKWEIMKKINPSAPEDVPSKVYVVTNELGQAEGTVQIPDAFTAIAAPGLSGQQAQDELNKDAGYTAGAGAPIKKWECYVLGMKPIPTESEKNNLPRAEGVQDANPSAIGFKMATPTMVKAVESGCEVQYEVEEYTSSACSGSPSAKSEKVNWDENASIPVPESGARYYKMKVFITPKR